MSQTYMLTACPYCNAVRVEVATIPVFKPPNRGQLTSGNIFDWSECKACLKGFEEMEREHKAAIAGLASLNETIKNAT